MCVAVCIFVILSLLEYCAHVLDLIYHFYLGNFGFDIVSFILHLTPSSFVYLSICLFILFAHLFCLLTFVYFFFHQGEHQWKLKDDIDREWMQGYQILPDKTKMVFDPAAEEIKAENLRKVIGSVADKVGDILSHSKMRCGGCGSKIGSQTLTRALARVKQMRSSSSQVGDKIQLGGYRDEVVTGVGDDAALLKSPNSGSNKNKDIKIYVLFVF